MDSFTNRFRRLPLIGQLIIIVVGVAALVLAAYAEETKQLSEAQIRDLLPFVAGVVGALIVLIDAVVGARRSAAEDAAYQARLSTLQEKIQQPLLPTQENTRDDHVTVVESHNANLDPPGRRSESGEGLTAAAAAEVVAARRDTAEERSIERAADERVQNLWLSSQITLERYWKRNLDQNSLIFRTSVAASAIGFIVMLASIRVAFIQQSSPTPSILTAVSGALTQIIGATFLFIYRSTAQQGTAYTETLERLTSTGVAWSMILTMSEATAKERVAKDAAKVSFATAVLGARPNLDSPGLRQPNSTQR